MLDVLFHPKSIAVIGASRTPGKVGFEVLSNLKNGGFAGQIVPVNPAAREILGLACYATPADYGRPVDLTVIALPCAGVLEAVRSSLAAGTKAVVVLTAGFGETGSQGTLAQTELARLCAQAKVRLLGPNCLGLIDTHYRLNASFARVMPPAGGISVLSQSGALCTAVLDWAHARGLGLAKIVSIGNKADLDETDFLKLFAADDETRVVIGYLESITCGDEFIQAARALTASKPFILLRGGVTRAGMWAACAHTGNLAGADTAYAAAFKRAGIIRAQSLDAVFDYAAAFAAQPLPRGDRVAIITNAGGPAVLAADAVERAGLKLAKLDGGAVERLKSELPPTASTFNPIDMLGDANPQRYAAAVGASQQDESVDATIVILTPHAMTRPAETIRAIVGQIPGAGVAADSSLVAPRSSLAGDEGGGMSEERQTAGCASPGQPFAESGPANLESGACGRPGKPVLLVFLGEANGELPGDRNPQGAKDTPGSPHPLPVYSSPQRAVAALQAMHEYRLHRSRPAYVITRFPVNRRRVERILLSHRRANRVRIGEVQAKEILRAYDLSVPDGAMANSPQEAVEIAERIGFPVALKAVSMEIVHKSDVGGVKLNVAGAEDVRDTYDLLTLRVGRRAPHAHLEGVYVEKMCGQGVQVILGITCDPKFGPLLVFGLGGTFVDRLNDRAWHLAPITAEEALQMLAETRSYALLQGTLDRENIDVSAIVSGLQRISQLATDFPQIRELSIDPYLVGPVGTEAMVVDARMTLYADPRPGQHEIPRGGVRGCGRAR
jgi:acetyl coenzyme A synthetase (ADP forming)-like protein